MTKRWITDNETKHPLLVEGDNPAKRISAFTHNDSVATSVVACRLMLSLLPSPPGIPREWYTTSLARFFHFNIEVR